MKLMAKNKVLNTPIPTKRVRYYGMVKPRVGAKLTWVSKQNKHGWSLGLIIGKRTFWLRNVRFANESEAQRAVRDLSIAYVHLAK